MEKLYKLNRREFLKLCGKIAAVLGLSQAYVPEIAAAIEKAARRPSVIWLNFAECTGCTESVIKTVDPSAAQLVLDILSIDYHDTIMAPAGKAAHAVLEGTHKEQKGKYILVVEGAIPLAEDGKYLMMAGRTGIDMATEFGRDAKAILAIGSCAFDGSPINFGANPAKNVGVVEATGLSREKFICLPGCPVNPINVISVVTSLLLKKTLELDEHLRPKIIYGTTIHENCERKKHFDKEQFVEQFGSREAELGYCLFKMGCKGPATFGNCPLVLWNDRTNWCVGAGAPCIGCTEPNYLKSFGGCYKELAASKLPEGFFA